MECSEIVYWIDVDGNRRAANGIQVGRFAVRRQTLATTLSLETGRVSRARQWAVDHVPTGLLFADCDDYGDALRVADDAARFSAADPRAASYHGARAQFGERLCTWARDMRATGRVVDFREWLCGQRQKEQA